MQSNCDNLISFLFEANNKILKKLAELGFPTAGMSYEFEKDCVIFDGLFRICSNGNLFIFDEPVDAPTFIKYARLYTNKDKKFFEAFVEDGNHVQNYIILDNGSIINKWFLSQHNNYDEFAEEKEIFGIKIQKGIPEKDLPLPFFVVECERDFCYQYNHGPFTVTLSASDDSFVDVYGQGNSIADPMFTPSPKDTPKNALKKVNSFVKTYIKTRAFPPWKLYRVYISGSFNDFVLYVHRPGFISRFDSCQNDATAIRTSKEIINADRIRERWTQVAVLSSADGTNVQYFQELIKKDYMFTLRMYKNTASLKFSNGATISGCDIHTVLNVHKFLKAIASF